MEMKCGTELEARADFCLPWEVRGLWGFYLSGLAQSSIPEMEDFYLQYPTLTCAPLKQPDSQSCPCVLTHSRGTTPIPALVLARTNPTCKGLCANPKLPLSFRFQVLWEKGTPDTPPPGKIGSANSQYC